MIKRLRIISLFLFIIGTLLIFSASYFELFFPPKNAFYLGIFGDIILAIIRSVGVSLITSTFINLLKFWVESTETLVKHDFINRLSRNEMKDLKEKLEKELYFRYNNHDKDNFYNFFEQELSSLLNECYYQSYKTRIECQVTDNYISKTIRKKFEIINPSKKECTIKIPFVAEMQRVEQVENNKLFQIKKFVVDSEDFTANINEGLQISDDCPHISDAYCVKIHTSWDVKVKKQCTIDMVIETIVPLNDVCFSNKITMPCKNYNVIFILNDPSYQLSWHSFGFMGNHKDRIVEEPMDNGLEIGFKDWILPGDGVVISITKCEKNHV
ncbi:MAG TPA: hypothetical protein PLA01_02600 [Acetivibrio sp.]|nr:hypothetical protein [Acetivibrio sp.]